MKTRFTLYVALVLAQAACASASGATIGIDARHGGSGGDTGNLALDAHYDEFRSTVTSSGHAIVNRFSFNSGDLASLDALILTQPSGGRDAVYSVAEISAIQNFVVSGHGLLVIGDGGFNKDSTVANLNALVMPYGVTYAGFVTGGSGQSINGFLPHPLTMGLGTIGVDFYRPFSFIGAPAVDLTVAGPEVLAAVSGVGGSGNVVLIGDSSLWTNTGDGGDTPISFGSNRLLLQNTLSFITVPEPATYALVMIAALGVFGFRKFSNRS